MGGDWRWLLYLSDTAGALQAVPCMVCRNLIFFAFFATSFYTIFLVFLLHFVIIVFKNVQRCAAYAEYGNSRAEYIHFCTH